MKLDSLTRPELIYPQLPGSDRQAVLHAFADRLEGQGVVADAGELYDRLWEREQLGSTGIGHGVAIPHCKMNGLDGVVLAVGITPKPIDFGAVDGKPVRLFFLVISPSHAPAAHLQCLAAISKWVKAEQHVRGLLDLDDPQTILARLGEEGA